MTCGGVELQLHHSLTLHLMEVSGQLHAPAALPSGETASAAHYSYVEGWVGPGTRLYFIEKRRISCPCRHPNPGRPARRYTDS
jgi:hypothetical protein